MKKEIEYIGDHQPKDKIEIEEDLAEVLVKTGEYAYVGSRIERNTGSGEIPKGRGNRKTPKSE